MRLWREAVSSSLRPGEVFPLIEVRDQVCQHYADPGKFNRCA